MVSILSSNVPLTLSVKEEDGRKNFVMSPCRGVGSNAVFCRKVAHQQVRCVISFDGVIDESRMVRAVRLSLEALPTTGLIEKG